MASECEICGSGEVEYIIEVEGAKMSVCRECSTVGKIIKRMPKEAMKSDAAFQPARTKVELEVVDGYGAIIQNARKKLGLPIEVLAERINEKASFLERIEHQKTLPDEKVARKLEKELGIKLLEEVVEQEAEGGGRSEAQITLGDIIELEKKEKKK
jgi:putative transcription factor